MRKKNCGIKIWDLQTAVPELMQYALQLQSLLNSNGLNDLFNSNSIWCILRGDYCTFNYFTEHFMLSRDGSIIEISRFIRMLKYHTHVEYKNNIYIIRMNRTIVDNIINLITTHFIFRSSIFSSFSTILAQSHDDCIFPTSLCLSSLQYLQYTVFPKKLPTLSSSISSPNIYRFSEFF